MIAGSMSMTIARHAPRLVVNVLRRAGKWLAAPKSARFGGRSLRHSCLAEQAHHVTLGMRFASR